MLRRIGLIAAIASASLALTPGPGIAASTESFDLLMDGAQEGRASNGDIVHVFGGGSFQAHPKSVTASGTFEHLDSAGNVLGGGSWQATDLLSFHFYGCRFIPAVGVDLGDDDLCGGAVKMRVELTTPAGTFDGVLTIFCIVGPEAPASHNTPDGEGATLDIPGVINFNHTVHGNNIYVRTG